MKCSEAVRKHLAMERVMLPTRPHKAVLKVTWRRVIWDGWKQRERCQRRNREAPKEILLNSNTYGAQARLQAICHSLA